MEQIETTIETLLQALDLANERHDLAGAFKIGAEIETLLNTMSEDTINLRIIQ